MKVTLIKFCLFASLFSFMSCNKLTQFNMDYDSEVVIPSSTGINLPLNLTSPEVETNSSETFEVNDTRKDKIEQIILTDLELSILTPSGQDFSFLKSISLFLSADGLPEVEIASQQNIESTSAILVLETSGADLQEYIKKDEFTLRTNVTTDEILTSDYHINVHQVYFVDAKIIGN